MRLLRAEDLTFKEFIGKNIPKYPIISHRWSDDEEVSYQDFVEGRQEFLSGRREGYGWLKIQEAQKITLRNELEWFWIDTCCIDKRSSAELTEAINSMYKWYRRSEECYVFLPDVDPRNSPDLDEHGSLDSEDDSEFDDHNSSDGDDDISVPSSDFDPEQFKSSVWFTRAWTLQELLAPRKLRFFNNRFEEIGSRDDLGKIISEATSIDRRFLDASLLLSSNRPRSDPRTACVAKRMRWASLREATREEDIAYSLLGLFEVNMPLLYGEGNKAFLRLQSEILKISTDETLFAWMLAAPIYSTGLFAHDIGHFSKIRQIQQGPLNEQRVWEETNMGLYLSIPLPKERLRLQIWKHGRAHILLPLNVWSAEVPDTQVAIRLEITPVLKWTDPKATPITPEQIFSGRRISGTLVYGSYIPGLSFDWPVGNGHNMVAGQGEDLVRYSVYFPNVIIIDMFLPDGRQLYDRLREDYESGGIYIQPKTPTLNSR